MNAVPEFEITKAAMQADLDRVLDHWIDLDVQWARDRLEEARQLGATAEQIAVMEAGSARITTMMAERARPFLPLFLEDNTDKTAEELERIASHLSPGGAHNGGLLIRFIRSNIWFADSLLVAATIRHNWHGGKLGFQFLPDPAETEAEEYDSEAYDLLEMFDVGTDGDPRRILTGDDRDFFDSLPDRFTVYRGCGGLSLDRAAAGVCWTTNREVAEWFANRKRDQIVVTARVKKSDVRLVKAGEFEVVCTPMKARAIQCRPHKEDWRPEMTWKPASELTPISSM